MLLAQHKCRSRSHNRKMLRSQVHSCRANQLSSNPMWTRAKLLLKNSARRNQLYQTFYRLNPLAKTYQHPKRSKIWNENSNKRMLQSSGKTYCYQLWTKAYRVSSRSKRSQQNRWKSKASVSRNLTWSTKRTATSCSGQRMRYYLTQGCIKVQWQHSRLRKTPES